MKFTLQGSTIIIDDICVISDQHTTEHNLINLTKRVGLDMNYQSKWINHIDYPGEYELGWLTINCITDSEWLLHYLVATEDRHIGYVQNPKLVTNRIFAEVTDWICDRDDVIVAIEKLDESGKIYDVRQS